MDMRGIHDDRCAASNDVACSIVSRLRQHDACQQGAKRKRLDLGAARADDDVAVPSISGRVHRLPEGVGWGRKRPRGGRCRMLPAMITGKGPSLTLIPADEARRIML